MQGILQWTSKSENGEQGDASPVPHSINQRERSPGNFDISVSLFLIRDKILHYPTFLCGKRMKIQQNYVAESGEQPVAHTGFSYGVGTVSSPGPYPEKAPPLFLFSSNLRYIIFQNHI